MMPSVPPRYHFDESGALKLDGKPVKVYFFADAPDMPWFQAKPIHNFLGTSTVAQTIARVDGDDKSSLKGLLETKGTPIRDGVSDKQPPTLETVGYHDGKAYYVNESGLYQIILGSDKPEAKAFKKWVTSAVLPTLRRVTGTSSALEKRKLEIELEDLEARTKRRRQLEEEEAAAARERQDAELKAMKERQDIELRVEHEKILLASQASSAEAHAAHNAALTSIKLKEAQRKKDVQENVEKGILSREDAEVLIRGSTGPAPCPCPSLAECRRRFGIPPHGQVS